MGEGGERKKPSSLRTRVARSRQAYSRKSNPMPLVVGAVVLVLMGIGLYLFVGTKPKKYVPDEPTAPAAGTTAQPSSSGAFSGPPRQVGTTPEEKATNLCFYAKDDAKKGKADQALSDLKNGLAGNDGYAAEIYFTMAMVVQEKIYATKDKSRQQDLYGEKVGYLEKAIEAADAGSKWTYGDPSFRRSKLDEILEQSKKSAGM